MQVSKNTNLDLQKAFIINYLKAHWELTQEIDPKLVDSAEVLPLTSEVLPPSSNERKGLLHVVFFFLLFLFYVVFFFLLKGCSVWKGISNKTSPLKHAAVAHSNSKQKHFFKRKGKAILQSLNNIFKSKDHMQQHYKGHQLRDVTCIIWWDKPSRNKD